jgi:dTMP kinase
MIEPGSPALWQDLSATLPWLKSRTRTTYSGWFVAFEGGDGAGKSTQLERLREWLEVRGIDIVVTREPGGTPLGHELRRLLLDGGDVASRAEVLLYAADRAQHVETVIRPALERGAVVLTDRYVDSSLAYQVGGRALDAEDVAKVNAWATTELVPDLTVLLDVDPAVSLGRIPGTPDRLESESPEFHERVRAAFKGLAAKEPRRYLVLDGTHPPEQVTTQLVRAVDAVLPSRLQRRLHAAPKRP